MDKPLYSDPTFNTAFGREVKEGGGCFCCKHSVMTFSKWTCTNGHTFPACKQTPWGGFKYEDKGYKVGTKHPGAGDE